MITQNGFRIYELAKRQNFNDKCNWAKKAVKMHERERQTERDGGGARMRKRIRNDKCDIGKAGKNLSLRFFPLLLLRAPLYSRPSKTK